MDALLALIILPSLSACHGIAEDTAETWDEDRQVEVPAGTFLMGCEPSEDPGCPADAQPAHEVNLSAFLLDRLEVQVGDYALCEEAGACSGSNAPGQPPTDPDLPMTWVTQSQAEAFCAWRGGRLPTEAEWEKAARGTEGSPYPWGEAEPDCTRATVPACGERIGPAGAHPSGASPYGALNMAGNAWELVSDYYGDTWYAESPSADPQGPDATGLRVVRGASLYSADSARVTRRLPAVGDAASPLVGFRCAADP